MISLPLGRRTVRRDVVVAAQGDGHGEQRRQTDQQAVGADRVDPGEHQEGARSDPDDPVRALEQAVLPEPAGAGQAPRRKWPMA